jgi:hypothetical protein
MHLATYLDLLDRGSGAMADSLRVVGGGHAEEVDVHHTATQLAGSYDGHRQSLEPFLARYEDHEAGPPERLHAKAMTQSRTGGIGLLRDLLDLYLLATYLQQAWTLVGQAAKGKRDADLVRTADSCSSDLEILLTWLETRMKVAAPQALLVADS